MAAQKGNGRKAGHAAPAKTHQPCVLGQKIPPTQRRAGQGAVMIGHILERLDRPRKSGMGWTARCPSHEDTSPSLSLREGDDGRVLIHCHGGCSTVDVVASLGLSMSDLFVPSSKPRRPPPAPGVSRRELQAAVDFERSVLYIIQCDKKRGRTISPVDLARAKLARQRLRVAGRLS